MPLDDFRKANLDNWNNRAEIHAVSRQYDVAGYVIDPSKLSDTVQIDRAELGDIRQCLAALSGDDQKATALRSAFDFRFISSP
jgi:2-phospho-L-lactate transferase/gluconeogenesis factor (CofD/UPF0052 family)